MLQFSIPCELVVTPGNGTMQNKFRLSTNGETVFENYETNLDEHQLAVCKQIAEAHARLLNKFATK